MLHGACETCVYSSKQNKTEAEAPSISIFYTLSTFSTFPSIVHEVMCFVMKQKTSKTNDVFSVVCVPCGVF